jgi:hypothetical protein
VARRAVCGRGWPAALSGTECRGPGCCRRGSRTPGAQGGPSRGPPAPGIRARAYRAKRFAGRNQVTAHDSESDMAASERVALAGGPRARDATHKTLRLGGREGGRGLRWLASRRLVAAQACCAGNRGMIAPRASAAIWAGRREQNAIRPAGRTPAGVPARHTTSQLSRDATRGRHG